MSVVDAIRELLEGTELSEEERKKAAIDETLSIYGELAREKLSELEHGDYSFEEKVDSLMLEYIRLANSIVISFLVAAKRNDNFVGFFGVPGSYLEQANNRYSQTIRYVLDKDKKEEESVEKPEPEVVAEKEAVEKKKAAPKRNPRTKKTVRSTPTND